MNDALGDRMKKNYENVSKTFLTRRMPVIIRLDGKAFHSFTRGFKKPFDEVFSDTMKKTMQYLCRNIQGCVFGYTQSDEISLLLVDYKNLNTDAWFNYATQKCVSVAASMATMAFNKYFSEFIDKFSEKNSICHYDESGFCMHFNTIENEIRYGNYNIALDKGAMFDARIFNIPKEEVVNYFIWRQNDCYRNCINSVAQQLFTQSKIFGNSTAELRQMIGDTYKYEDWQLLGTSALKEFSGSAPTSIYVDGISGMLNPGVYWELVSFDFKENRNIIDKQFIFN